MKVVSKISEIRKIRRGIQPTTRVGVVPTMGYLHAGHASLIAQARKECDLVFATVFVNPTQFGPKEDLSRYPRNLDGDIALLQKEGCDVLFAPNADEMYVPDHRTWVTVDGIDSTAEGVKRPGHFRGVATVVTKIFNIFQPDKAYFGQKDAVQCILIRKMVKDLNFPIDVVIGPTIRDPDGLAMSSRNSYLSQRDRAIAPILYKALKAGQSTYESMHRPTTSDIVNACTRVIQAHPAGIEIDYISLASMDTGVEITEERLPSSSDGFLLSGVIKMGTTRLLDNVILAAKQS